MRYLSILTIIIIGISLCNTGFSGEKMVVSKKLPELPKKPMERILDKMVNGIVIHPQDANFAEVIFSPFSLTFKISF